MMFVRAPILRKIHGDLHDVEFEDGDSLGPKQHLDGQAAHAIERVIGAVARANGLSFWWRR
jgi:lipopolysaccharide biosynthesis protein